MLSSLLASSNCQWTDQLTTGRAGFCFCLWFVLFAFWCFCLFCLFLGFWCLLLSCTVTAQWIMYRSNSVLFCMHIVVMTDVATALIRWICKMQLSFRLDKRPGESHLALDGKKHFFLSCCEKATGEDIKQTSHYRSVKKIFVSASTSFIQIQFFLAGMIDRHWVVTFSVIFWSDCRWLVESWKRAKSPMAEKHFHASMI